MREAAEKAEEYAEKGYIHYHELVSVELVNDSIENGEPQPEEYEFHPDKIVWLRHTAETSFTLDGGPMPDMVAHEVTPGIDYEFMPNWDEPYTGEPHQ